MTNIVFEDMRPVCNPCHKIHTYSQRENISFEEARVKKAYIAWDNTHKVAQQKDILIKLGASEEEVKNKASREKAYYKYMNEE